MKKAFVLGDSISMGYREYVKEALEGKAEVVYSEGLIQSSKPNMETFSGTRMPRAVRLRMACMASLSLRQTIAVVLRVDICSARESWSILASGPWGLAFRPAWRMALQYPS